MHRRLLSYLLLIPQVLHGGLGCACHHWFEYHEGAQAKAVVVPVADPIHLVSTGSICEGQRIEEDAAVELVGLELVGLQSAGLQLAIVESSRTGLSGPTSIVRQLGQNPRTAPPTLPCHCHCCDAVAFTQSFSRNVAIATFDWEIARTNTTHCFFDAASAALEIANIYQVPPDLGACTSLRRCAHSQVWRI